MQTLQNSIMRTVQIDLQRDQCPVITRTESDLSDIKKQFAKLNKHLRGMTLSADPAIGLKRSRNQRGLQRGLV